MTWEIVDARPRQIVKKLCPNDPAVMLPDGVSVALINAFRTELFNMLYPSAQHGKELGVGDATSHSRNKLAKALDEINGAKLNGYRRTWDAENGVPGNWLGADISDGDGLAGSSAALLPQGSSTAAQTVQGEPTGTEDNPIPLDEAGTHDDPINLDGDSTPEPVSIDNAQALVLPMHQRDKFMQLTKLGATPMHFRYAIAPSRLRAMAKRNTNNNKAAIVVGVVRRPDWNAAQTFPEYICIALLEGGNSLRIRVKRCSIEGEELPKWPGGGSVYISLEEIEQYGYLFRPFYDFDRERLRRYLMAMEEQDKMPNVRDKAVVLRGG